MQSIHTLSIDLETRSGADLKKTGVYRYTEDPDFDILLFGYSADGGPVLFLRRRWKRLRIILL